MDVETDNRRDDTDATTTEAQQGATQRQGSNNDSPMADESTHDSHRPAHPPSPVPPASSNAMEGSPPDERTIPGAGNTMSNSASIEPTAERPGNESNAVSASNERLNGPIAAPSQTMPAPAPDLNTGTPSPVPSVQPHDVENDTTAENLASDASLSVSAKRLRPDDLNDDGSPAEMKPWMGEIWSKLWEASSSEEWKELMRLWGELEWCLGLPDGGRVSVWYLERTKIHADLVFVPRVKHTS